MAKLSCAACNKRITGNYIQALKHAWHVNCFRCAVCGEVINTQQFAEHKGKPYHAHCYEQLFSPRCSACGEPVTGEYLRALNKLWHPEHFVCARCGRQIRRSYFVKRGKPYCQEDYLLLFAEKCALCGQPLVGRFFEDVWGNKYCERHEQDPRCMSCERLIGQILTDGGVRYADDRILCTACSKKGIRKTEEAHAIFQDVQTLLKQYDLQIDSHAQIPIRLVDQNELRENLPKRRGRFQPAGLTKNKIETINGSEMSREVEAILALYGLPPEHLGAVLAHEMGHAWLFLNRFPVLPQKLEEGICEFFASLWLKSLDSEHASVRLKLLEKNPDPVYGTGYRNIRRAVERSSLPYVLNHVKRRSILPK